VRNVGRTTWPVAVAFGEESPLQVHVLARVVAKGATRELDSASVELSRDVDPWESVVGLGHVEAPQQPGRYALVLKVEQAGGRAFGGARAVIKHHFRVEPAQEPSQ
jgi:hypothetical protein